MVVSPYTGTDAHIGDRNMMAQQPPSVGTTTASEPGRKNVLSPAPTDSKGNLRSRRQRRKTSARQSLAASSSQTSALSTGS
jgi:hypothetical protein